MLADGLHNRKGLKGIAGRPDSIEARLTGDDLNEDPGIVSAGVGWNHPDFFDQQRWQAARLLSVDLRRCQRHGKEAFQNIPTLHRALLKESPPSEGWRPSAAGVGLWKLRQPTSATVSLAPRAVKNVRSVTAPASNSTATPRFPRLVCCSCSRQAN